jgi:hypothetical protein
MKVTAGPSIILEASHTMRKPLSKPPFAAQFRQGDVLLTRVRGRVPKAAVAIPRDNGRVVLAYGEVTGHAHAIRDEGVALLTLDDHEAMAEAARKLLASVGLTKMDLRPDDVVGILEVGADGAALTHDEHETHQFAEGTYVVTRQREYSPEAIRSVAD